jgi:integrase
MKRTGNAKLVQRYLGHSDVATTLRFYVDVFPEDLKHAAELLSEESKKMQFIEG